MDKITEGIVLNNIEKTTASAGRTRKRGTFDWVESWPFIIGVLLLALCWLLARAGAA